MHADERRLRPILFSTQMVQAILSGHKSQTRRLVFTARAKAQYGASRDDYDTVADSGIVRVPWTADRIRKLLACPYGQPGDGLWVREAWHAMGYEGVRPILIPPDTQIIYKADAIHGVRWKPGIHMPKWASRIRLTITSVRAERLQDMSYQDWRRDFCFNPRDWERGLASGTGHQYQQNHSRQLWDSINGASGNTWASNPWVWVVDFRRSSASIGGRLNGSQPGAAVPLTTSH